MVWLVSLTAKAVPLVTQNIFVEFRDQGQVPVLLTIMLDSPGHQALPELRGMDNDLHPLGEMLHWVLQIRGIGLTQ